MQFSSLTLCSGEILRHLRLGISYAATSIKYFVTGYFKFKQNLNYRDNEKRSEKESAKMIDFEMSVASYFGKSENNDCLIEFFHFIDSHLVFL